LLPCPAIGYRLLERVFGSPGCLLRVCLEREFRSAAEARAAGSLSRDCKEIKLVFEEETVLR